MTLRVAFDMDGVLADFAAAYRDVEVRLFGASEPIEPEYPDEDKGDCRATDSSVRKHIQRQHQKRTAVWEAIRATRDFWATLPPTDPDAVRRLHALTLEHRWEVFFMTQRPATSGDTVQRQTQRWLRAQGFDIPSVLVMPHSRSAVSSALALHYYIDDNTTNCVDFKSDSRGHPILIVDDDTDPTKTTVARRLGIATARDIGAALDILDRTGHANGRPAALQQLAHFVGWT